MYINDYLTEIITGFTIAQIMIPESMAFSLLLGLPPSVGLHSTMIMSFITSLFGGCPGLISGSTAAVATSLAGINTFVGKEYIFLGVIMGGFIQILMGITGFYKLIYNISKPVTSGFLVTLGVLIAMAQLDNFKDSKTEKWFEGEELFATLFFSLLAALISFYGLVVVKFSKLRNLGMHIPGELISIAIIIGLFLILPFKLPIEKIGDRGDVHNTIPKIQLPTIDSNILKVLPFSIAMAVAGLTDSILMVKEASQTLNVKGNPLQETIVQGIANIISGLCGGIGGCVIVGETKSNLENGSKTRVASISASLFFIIFTLFFSKGIELIPMPAIIGILLTVAYKTGDWSSLLQGFDTKWFVVVCTAIIGISTGNLTMAIISGSVIEKIVQKIRE